MRALRGGASAVAVATLLVTLTACTPSPKTTYTNDAGETITVNWRTYPAHAYVDAQVVLDGPAMEEVPERWAEIRAAVTAAIDEELGGALVGVEWTEHGEGSWTPTPGNGYGGESMLTTYNSGSWEAEVVLDEEDWPRVIAAARAELAEWGITGTAPDPEEVPEWLRYADFFDGSEFVSVGVQDAALDPEAKAEAEERGWLVSGISLFYGIQTIAAADRAAFEKAAAPFAGLDRPEPTTSD